MKVHKCNGKVERTFYEVTTKVGRKHETGTYRSRHSSIEGVRAVFEKNGHKVVSVTPL